MTLHPVSIRWITSLMRRAAVLMVATLLTGCVTTTALKRPDLIAPPSSGTRILVMTPDVELSEVTAGGLEEPNAQWTALGKQHVGAALNSFMASREVVPVAYREPDSASPEANADLQLLKLHEAVGGTILVHKYNQAALLPTKAEGFDWTLGEDARRLREKSGADYALFVFLHDSYASGGRVAMMMAMAVLGVAVPGGIQRGFASLVDLRSGDIAWFNVLVRGTGDLRTTDAASDAVTTLLAEIPL